MTEKRFTTDTPNSLSEIYDDGRILTNGEVIKYINWYREDMRKFSVENEQLKQENKKLKRSFGNIRNSISRLYRNGQITFDERAFYLKKLSEIEDGDVE